MRNFLPRGLRFTHQYCFFLHDLLVEIIVFGEPAGIFNVNFKFKKKAHANAIKGKTGEELFKWMEANGYRDMAALLVYKRVFIGLLSDFCHFVYEAMQNSRKSKLTVTYALLRKPFKENLLFLEWLLADAPGFIKTFYSGDIRQLSLSSSFSREKKIEVISNAMDKTPMKRWVDPEFIYQLRYDKGAEFSLEHLWQKANHLITTFNFLETEEKNFNFIFSGKEEMIAQWDHLYFTLPILLFHARQIIETLLSTFVKEVTPNKDYTDMRAVLGLLLCMQDEEMQRRLSNIERDMQSLLKAVHLHCPKCDRRVTYGKGTLKHIYLYSGLKCTQCGYRMTFGEHLQTPHNKRKHAVRSFGN